MNMSLILSETVLIGPYGPLPWEELFLAGAFGWSAFMVLALRFGEVLTIR